MARNKKKKKRKSFIKSFFKFICILIILALITIIVLVIADPLGIKKIPENKFSTTDKNLNISSKVNFDEDIINIALIGADNLEQASQRADTIVIMSYNTKTGRMALTSVMRDLLVYIPDKNKYDKINASYSYGGAQLLLKTLNNNFDLNIKHYITVDFKAMEKLVDAVGGVNINVKSEEIKYINQAIREQNRELGGELKYLEKSGNQKLNGRQALAYSRIRKVGNADWERTSRQRTVINAIISKVRNEMSIKMLISLAKNAAPYVKTNISTKTMFSLMTSYIKHKDTFVIEDFRLPYDYHALDEYYNGIYYLKPNTLKDNVTLLHQYIFGIDSYEPTGTVKEISNYIQYNH